MNRNESDLPDIGEYDDAEEYRYFLDMAQAELAKDPAWDQWLEYIDLKNRSERNEIPQPSDK
jgi:hypothetical protein